MKCESENILLDSRDKKHNKEKTKFINFMR